MMTQLEQLRSMSTVVADTGDIESILRYRPHDATTNPTLLLKAFALPVWQPQVQQALTLAAQEGDNHGFAGRAAEHLAVLIGCKILEVVPGYLSTEVDARLSFDTARTIDGAKRLIDLYHRAGGDTDRVLVKIAATWEGIAAARQLERDGIATNLTLLFNLTQARACADAGVTLISPFVGRILDWHKKNRGLSLHSPAEDPGVQSVTRIFHYYKQHNYNTIIMGASFRNKEEVLELAGCDRLTISPALLEELSRDRTPIEKKLQSSGSSKGAAAAAMGQERFRWQMNEDPMATEKLAEGIRNFAVDSGKLEECIKAHCATAANVT